MFVQIIRRLKQLQDELMSYSLQRRVLVRDCASVEGIMKLSPHLLEPITKGHECQ